MKTKHWMPREKLLEHISAVIRGVSPRLDLVTRFGKRICLCKVYRLNPHVTRVDIMPKEQYGEKTAAPRKTSR